MNFDVQDDRVEDSSVGSHGGMIAWQCLLIGKKRTVELNGCLHKRARAAMPECQCQQRGICNQGTSKYAMV